MLDSNLGKLLLFSSLLLIIPIGFFIQKKFKKKNSDFDFISNPASPEPEQANEDPQIVDYIKNYKSSYNKDAIKQALISAGKDGTEVDKLLEKYF